MAEPMTATQFAAALRAEGLNVLEIAGWRTHNRNTKGPWGPLQGVMIHHTASSGSARTVAMCRDGYASLPGPLCHGVITKDGRVHLVGYGRANHAGLGDGDVLRAVMDERQAPVDDEANTDGNRHFYGFECENLGDGEDPWPKAQLDAIERVSAAICRHHGWDPKRVIRHLDWQPGKPDPRGVDWTAMRKAIAARLGVKPPTTTPPPSAPTVSLQRLRTAALSDPERSGSPVTYKGVAILEAALVDRGMLEKPYSDGHYGSATVRAYARWQRSKEGGSYRGDDADGIPGHGSLRRLGLQAGFKVED